MPTPDTRREPPQRASAPARRLSRQEAQAEWLRTQRRLTHLMDPYDTRETRPEPQPEEPGYGHGV